MTITERNGLVEKYLPLVRSTAADLVRRGVPASIEFDDLVGEGQLALLDAATRFDPARGYTFGVWARYRVRGAMLDSMKRRHYRNATCESIEQFDASGEERTPEVPACLRVEPDYDVAIDEQRTRRMVGRAIAATPDGERQVVELTFFSEERRTLSVVARAAGIPGGRRRRERRVVELRRRGLAMVKAELGRAGFKAA